MDGLTQAVLIICILHLIFKIIKMMKKIFLIVGILILSCSKDQEINSEENTNDDIVDNTIKYLEEEIIICGGNSVFIVSIDIEKNKNNIIWGWQPNDASSLPITYQQNYFSTIDECKPTNEGKEIMITSSKGGVVIIDKKSKDAIFYTYVANAHSIEELPNNIIAVAAANHEEGNSISLFNKNESGGNAIFKDDLFGAHGVVWDKQQQILYALGSTNLRTYKLVIETNTSPFLDKLKELKLPDGGGHDLVASPNDSNELILTTSNNVWKFNKQSSTFSEFTPLANVKSVKGVSVKNNQNNEQRIIYIKAEEEWWSHNIYLINPEYKISFPGNNLYKVRWMDQYV